MIYWPMKENENGKWRDNANINDINDSVAYYYSWNDIIKQWY